MIDLSSKTVSEPTTTRREPVAVSSVGVDPLSARQRWWSISVLIGWLVVMFLESAAGAQEAEVIEQFPLVWDPDWSASVGASDMGSLSRGLDRALDVAFDQVPELSVGAEISIRAGRLVLVDFPLSLLLIWSQHEVFGHGARLREFGLAHSFSIAVPPPYGFEPENNLTIYDEEDVFQLSLSRQVLVSTEGREAEELLTRDWIREAMRVGRAGRLLDTVVMARAVGDLSRVSRESDWTETRSMVEEMPIEGALLEQWPTYLSWALDPLFWWTLYDYFYANLVRGDPPGPLPAFTLGAWELLVRPSLRFSPWGQELGLVAVASTAGMVGETEVVVGPLAGSPALSLAIEGKAYDCLGLMDLGGGLRIWTQPAELTLDFAGELPVQFGYTVEIEAVFWLFDWSAVLGRVGLKSNGYTPGRPYDEGVYGQIGVAFAL